MCYSVMFIWISNFEFYNFNSSMIFGINMAIFQRWINKLCIITNPNLQLFKYLLLEYFFQFFSHYPIFDIIFTHVFVMFLLCFGYPFFLLMIVFDNPNILEAYFTALELNFNDQFWSLSFSLSNLDVPIIAINIVCSKICRILYHFMTGSSPRRPLFYTPSHLSELQSCR